MSLLEDILENLPDNAPVSSVLIGVRWTMVCSHHCGLASTLTGSGCCDGNTHSRNPVRDAGNLHMKDAHQLSEYALSDDLLEASIGMATINSLLAVSPNSTMEINASEILLKKGRSKKVAIVGRFPFIPKIRVAFEQLWVLEQSPLQGELPADMAGDILPQADVVAITGTTLINHTFNKLIESCRPDATVIMLGPSTPLSPILFDYGVSIISGTQVIDEDAARLTISQATSFRQMKGVRLVTITKDRMRML